MAERRTSSFRWLQLFAVAAVALLAVIATLDVIAPRYFLRQSQVDLSTGRERFVTRVFGVQFAGAEHESFASRQLAGERMADQPNWKPLGSAEGLLFSMGSMGHSPWDPCWHKAEDSLAVSWFVAGFTEEARTESVRRLLVSLSSGENGWPNSDYLRIIEQLAEPMHDNHLFARVTNVDDLPQPDARLPQR